MRFPKLSVKLLAATVFLSLSSCYRVPVTGRHALNLVDHKEVVRMSIAAFEDMKKQYPISRDPTMNAQLQRVGQKISRAVFWDMPDADWEFVVFDVPDEINAFAMSGGKVGVFSGLFKIIENDDQLAAVLSHEIAHVTAKHVDERLSQAEMMQGLGSAGGIAMMGSGLGALTTMTVLDIYGVGAGATAIAYDRDKEAEADRIGLIYMSRAGYDPREAVKVLQNLEDATANLPKPPEIESTHPSNPARISALEEEMPEALKVREESNKEIVPVIIK